MNMETIRLDIPSDCKQIVMLLNGGAINFNSTKSLQNYCEKMRLRVTGTSKQGQLYLVQVQREDSSL